MARRSEPSTAVLDAPTIPRTQEPPTRPPTPPVAVPVLPDVVGAQIRERAERLEAAEAILSHQALGGEVTPDQDAFLRSVFPDTDQRNAELRRVHRKATLQARARSGAERAAATARRDATAATLATEGPSKRAEIDRLQAELTALEKSAADAASVVETQAAAVAALADPVLLGEPHRSRYEFARKTWERDFGIPARTARRHAEGLRALAGLSPDDSEDAHQIALHAEQRPELAGMVRAVNAPQSSTWLPNRSAATSAAGMKIDRAAWSRHATTLQIEAAEAAAEAERLEQAGAEARAELDAMLQSLIPE